MLIKRLTRSGNSLGVIIPKTIRDLLGWEEDAQLEYHPEGDTLRLVPAKTRQEEAVDLLFPGTHGRTDATA